MRIIVDHVSKAYEFYVSHGLFRRQKKSVQALSDISFQVNKGSVMGLVGPNGSGKTTTVKLVSGVMYCPEGKILIDGLNPYDKYLSYRQKVTLFMGTRGRLDPDMSIRELSDMYAGIYGLSRQKARTQLMQMGEMLNLSSDLLNKQVRTLSLGQRMKGEICLAFLHRPEIIFLDEPTIGLDSVSSKAIRHFLVDYVKSSGAAMILTSHQLRDIEDTCDSLFILKNGTQAYYGNLDNLPRQFAVNTKITFQLEKQPAAEKLLLKNYHLAKAGEKTYQIDCSYEDIDDLLNAIYSLGPVSKLKIEKLDFESMIEAMTI